MGLKGGGKKRNERASERDKREHGGRRKEKMATQVLNGCSAARSLGGYDICGRLKTGAVVSHGVLTRTSLQRELVPTHKSNIIYPRGRGHIPSILAPATTE